VKKDWHHLKEIANDNEKKNNNSKKLGRKHWKKKNSLGRH